MNTEKKLRALLSDNITQNGESVLYRIGRQSTPHAYGFKNALVIRKFLQGNINKRNATTLWRFSF